jgi:hypothetical protein
MQLTSAHAVHHLLNQLDLSRFDIEAIERALALS